MQRNDLPPQPERAVQPAEDSGGRPGRDGEPGDVLRLLRGAHEVRKKRGGLRLRLRKRADGYPLQRRALCVQRKQKMSRGKRQRRLLLFGPERGQRNRMLHVPAARVKTESVPACGRYGLKPRRPSFIVWRWNRKSGWIIILFALRFGACLWFQTKFSRDTNFVQKLPRFSVFTFAFYANVI